jgi:hypothetical protein
MVIIKKIIKRICKYLSIILVSFYSLVIAIALFFVFLFPKNLASYFYSVPQYGPLIFLVYCIARNINKPNIATLVTEYLIFLISIIYLSYTNILMDTYSNGIFLNNFTNIIIDHVINFKWATDSVMFMHGIYDAAVLLFLFSLLYIYRIRMVIKQ